MKPFTNRLFIASLLFFLTFTGAAQREITNVAYGADKQQTLDLYLPKTVGEDTPVIIMIHGGAWIMGGKHYTEDTSKDLCSRGFVVANIDYRYVSPTVHAADLLSDIRKATQKVASFARQYGYPSSGYHFSGVSAGAHLALLYGYANKNAVKSLAVLCGPVRLDTHEHLAFVEKVQLIQPVEWLADANYKAGKAVPAAFTAISPYASITNVPTLLIHGDADELVPYPQAVFMLGELKSKGVEARLITQKGKGHDCGMNDADTRKAALDGIEQWVRAHD